MDQENTQGGIWDGDGPQLSEPTPAVVCQFEHAPLRCTFPECACSDIPDLLRRDADGGFASERVLAPALVEPGYTHPEPETRSTGVLVTKRQPKRDRAAYMRDYRARRKQARTQ